jgi:hypothetical protein
VLMLQLGIVLNSTMGSSALPQYHAFNECLCKAQVTLLTVARATGRWADA